MVETRKGRAGSKRPSASATQAESSESATAQASVVPVNIEGPEHSNSERSDSDSEPPTNTEQPSSRLLQDLRRRVAEKEEYTALLRRIQELEQEQGILTQAPRRQNELIAPTTSRGPRFDKHSVEYRGKTLQELRQWIRAVEDDHDNYPETFTSDQKRVFYASKALKLDSLAYKHWTAKREQVNSLEEISWADFLDVLYNALGSKESRMARAYYNHQEATWDPKKQSIMEFYRKLRSYEETFVKPIDDHYLYYQMWRQIPDEYRDKLIGTNKPKTREEIVKAIEELDIDRKRDRSQSDAAKQSESKRPKPNRDHPASRGNHRQQQNPSNPKPPSQEGTRESKEAKDPKVSTTLICNFCKKPGHMERNCYSKYGRPGTSSTNPNRIAVASTSESGKDQALPNQSSSQQRRTQ